MTQLTVNINSILYNFLHIQSLCKKNSLEFWPVTKCVRSVPQIVNLMPNLNAITDVYNQNLTEYTTTKTTILLSATRSICEEKIIPDIIYTFDPYIINNISLSHPESRFIIPIETGGLREGLVPDYYENFISELDKNAATKIIGFSTNYGCIHGLTPELKDIEEYHETAISLAKISGIENPVISAGGTILYPFLENEELTGLLTHIRMGESFLFGFNTFTNKKIEGLRSDVFTLSGEIIESKLVNTDIEGNLTVTALGVEFDNSTKLMCNGFRNRTVIDFGVMTAQSKSLNPINNNHIICGQTYDHTVIDTGFIEKLGDSINFICSYDAVVRAFHHPYTKIFYNWSNNVQS